MIYFILNLIASGFYYSIIGVITECLFTGFKNLLLFKDKAAKCETNLYSFPIFGAGGLALQTIHNSISLSDNFILNALLMAALFYVPLIYGIEFLSGWALLKTIGKIPWDYGRGKFTIMGLIRLDYAPFWFAVAATFPIFKFFFDILKQKFAIA